MCIKLHFYLVIVAIYFYAIHKLNLFLIFYLFAIFHELAHILIALIFRIKVQEIALLPVGVCAKFDYIDHTIKETIIAAAGPLFSIVVGLISKDLQIRNVNFAIAFLNLIPLYPLDGGRLLRGAMQMFFGYKKSIVFSNYLAKVLLVGLAIAGIALAVYFKNFSLIFLDIYIFFLIKEEVKKDRIRKVIHSLLGESDS
ncbi:MAG: M50 family metallopeptidase [Clostridia bacterium]|nr:M50 family metallopeptidase [Clostridia bacterium]